MFKFLNIEPEIFGIDVNDLSLRIVKIRKKRKGFSIVSWNEIRLREGVIKDGLIQDQDGLVNAIVQAVETIKGKKLDTKFVAISLPEEKSFSQVIQMPGMTYDELATAVPFETENYIPLTIDKVYLDFQTIHDSAGEKSSVHTDVLVNVMPRPVIDAYIASFKKAGLIPCIVEIESQSIVRSLVKKNESIKPVIFIDLGTANTSFIIYSGNSVRFTSSIPISSHELTEAIAKRMDISLEKAEMLKIRHGLTAKKGEKQAEIADIMEPMLTDLAEQVKKYISFYKDHAPHEYLASHGNIEKIILSGGGANLKGIVDFLYKKIKIPVELGDPLVNIRPMSRNRGHLVPAQKALSFTTALGLALRGAGFHHDSQANASDNQTSPFL